MYAYVHYYLIYTWHTITDNQEELTVQPVTHWTRPTTAYSYTNYDQAELSIETDDCESEIVSWRLTATVC